MGMFSPPLIIMLALSVSGVSRRPASVALTWEGKSVGLEVVDFLRFRLQETFAIEASSVPAEPPGEGDFHVHVAALPNDVFEVRVEEAGATIASRELIAPEDVGTELWFFMKTTLRRALFTSAPGGPRLEGSAAADPRDSELTLSAAIRPPSTDLRRRGTSEIAIRVMGGFSFGANALEKAGVLSADYRFDLFDTRTSLVLGAEVGYVFSSPRANFAVQKIPLDLSAGLRLSESVPVVLGVFGGVAHVRAESDASNDGAFVGDFGPFVRGGGEVLDGLALVVDARARFSAPRVRYLLPDRTTAILESMATLGVSVGAEWRWR